MKQRFPIVAYLNTRLKTPGVGEKSMNQVINKYNLRRRFKNNGITVPSFKVYTRKEIKSSINKIKFPKIIKPTFGSASRGIFVAKDKKHFGSSLKNLKNIITIIF